MIKQIRTDQLKPGMFIPGLNCGWLDQPFISSIFRVGGLAIVDVYDAIAPASIASFESYEKWTIDPCQ